jgi:glyoxylase-like metal-dependent hydrolase (beta-lactamase superfamily II)
LSDFAEPLAKGLPKVSDNRIGRELQIGLSSDFYGFQGIFKMRIVPISIPTPFYVGSVNIYLIKEDPLTLIDVGPKTPEAAQVLREKLAQNGVKMADIKRIVLTHAHEDHCGLAKKVRDEAKNSEIFVHGWETGHLFGRLAQEEHRQLMFRAGVPDGVFKEMQEAYEEVSLLTDSLADGEFSGLTDGMELEFESGSLQVVHTPGHTPGSCTFVRLADRTVICGDCVLKRITPNPIVSPDPEDRTRRFKSLAQYLSSLSKIRSLAPTIVHGGHGEPIADFEEIFHRYMKAIEDRQRKVIGLVSKEGSTAYDVARRLFPDAQGDDVHRFLSISESIAHLDFAESKGEVGVEISDGIEIYRK